MKFFDAFQPLINTILTEEIKRLCGFNAKLAHSRYHLTPTFNKA
ncbi:hypothetical protein [Pedobacter sp. HMWF019]|nr:hypothetical protein [Pedobacter sp. HMWF019]